MNAVEQNALYITSIIILLGTLTTFIVQFVRMRRRDKGSGDGDGRDRGDGGGAAG